MLIKAEVSGVAVAPACFFVLLLACPMEQLFVSYQHKNWVGSWQPSAVRAGWPESGLLGDFLRLFVNSWEKRNGDSGMSGAQALLMALEAQRGQLDLLI